MNMPRLIFIVEGDSEQRFINEHLVSYLALKYPGVPMHAQKITTNRKKNVKGGNVNYELLKNEIKRTFAQGGVMITTFLDFFRLPTDYPGYTQDVKQIDQIEDAIRTDCNSIIPPTSFLPYIQKHEFETLMFANAAGFSSVVDTAELNEILNVLKQFSTPEDINGSPETAPSKRLLSIFKYKKVADSALVLKDVDIDLLRRRCPRFNEWVARLEGALECGHF
jgi:hypothetical protein